MAGAAGALRAQVESVAKQFTVNEIDASGKVTLEPELSVQEAMTRQIGQLWEEHANFQGISDTEDEDAEAADSTNADERANKERQESGDAGASDMDAYAVRAKVHEQLLLAQSEVQVSLDIVRLLLTAKKQAARSVALALQGSALVRHDQPQDASIGFAARVGEAGTEVTVGGVAFPTSILGTSRVDATNAHGQAEQQLQRKRREEELRFVLGAKHQQLADAADTLERSARRLRGMTAAESRFWRTAFELRSRNWVVLHHRQVAAAAARNQRAPRASQWLADRYFVPFGCHDSGAPAADDAMAELIRDEPEDCIENRSAGADADTDAMDTSSIELQQQQQQQAVPMYVPKAGRRCVTVDLSVAGGRQGECLVLGSAGPRETGASSKTQSPYDGLHRRLLDAQRTMFDRELYHRLCREARVLELGAIRTADDPLIRDMLVTMLSRDNVGVRFEWVLRDLDEKTDQGSSDMMVDEGNSGGSTSEPSDGFARWQGQYYSGLALVLATMFQRRVHRAAAAFQHGDGLESRALSSAGARGPLPEPFASAPSTGEASTTGEGTATAAAAVVGRPDLLILSPVLQRVQFAKWQHVVSGAITHACRAWRQLVNEPIEVISHLISTYRMRSAAEMTGSEERSLLQFCASGERPAPPRGSATLDEDELMAFVMRVRFPGGTVMAFWLDSLGHLYYVKGFYPPLIKGPPDEAVDRARAVRHEQDLTRRVFRVVPLGGLSDFVDQLKRELQALALLRVAAALSASRSHGSAGRWRVHQSQMCVVGEWRQGASAHQIIGVAKWDSQDGEELALTGGRECGDWRLTIYFGPKHPIVPDASRPASAIATGTGACGPWVTCYPPPGSACGDRWWPGTTQSFEERLADLLASSF